MTVTNDATPTAKLAFDANGDISLTDLGSHDDIFTISRGINAYIITHDSGGPDDTIDVIGVPGTVVDPRTPTKSPFLLPLSFRAPNN